MAAETIGDAGARLCGVAYVFIHYSLLVAYFLQGGALPLTPTLTPTLTLTPTPNSNPNPDPDQAAPCCSSCCPVTWPPRRKPSARRSSP